MKVEAIRDGYVGGIRRKIGAQFDLPSRIKKMPDWVKPVEEERVVRSASRDKPAVEKADSDKPGAQRVVHHSSSHGADKK